MNPRLRERLRHFIEHPACGVSILLLILVSVGLLILEIAAPPADSTRQNLELANDLILLVFLVELVLRWLVSSSTRRFFSEYWIDILALLPLLRVFRLGRAFRLVRLFRLLSLGALVNRQLATLQHLFRRRLVESFLLAVFCLFVLIFGTVGLLSFERERFAEPADAVWATLYTLLAGEFIDQFPASPAGRLTALAIMFFSMTFFAMVTGTVSAVMMEKLRRGVSARTMDSRDWNNHIIICGVNNKLSVLIREFQLDPVHRQQIIAVVAENINDEELEEQFRAGGIDCGRLFFVDGDFTRLEVLERVGVRQAACAVILADRRSHGSDYDVDARTVLAALTIERLHPEIYTCAELLHREYESHLRMGGVNDIVVTEDFGGNILAHATINRGLTQFFDELLTHRYGNEVYKLPMPAQLAGLSFRQAAARLLADSEMLLVGLERERKIRVNPQDLTLQEGDRVLIIAEERPEFAA